MSLIGASTLCKLIDVTWL